MRNRKAAPGQYKLDFAALSRPGAEQPLSEVSAPQVLKTSVKKDNLPPSPEQAAKTLEASILKSPALAQFIKRLDRQNLPQGTKICDPHYYLSDKGQKLVLRLQGDLEAQDNLGLYGKYSTLNELFAAHDIPADNLRLDQIESRPGLLRFLGECFFTRSSLTVMGATRSGKTFAAIIAGEFVHARKDRNGNTSVPLSSSKPLRILLRPTEELVEDVLKDYAPRIFRDTSHVGIVTGGVSSPEKRREVYERHSLIVATPEAFYNDLEKGRVDPHSISLIQLDEVHRLINRGEARALRKATLPEGIFESAYAFAKIRKYFIERGIPVTIHGFSATPGDNYETQGRHIQKLLGNDCNFTFLSPVFEERPKVVIQIPFDEPTQKALSETYTAVHMLLKKFSHDFRKFEVLGKRLAGISKLLDQLLDEEGVVRAEAASDPAFLEIKMDAVFGAISTLKKDIISRKIDLPDKGEIDPYTRRRGPTYGLALSFLESFLEVSRQRRQLIQFGRNMFCESVGKRIQRYELEKARTVPGESSTAKLFIERVYDSGNWTGQAMRRAYAAAAGESPYRKVLDIIGWNQGGDLEADEYLQSGRQFFLDPKRGLELRLEVIRKILLQCFHDKKGMFFTNRRANTGYASEWLNQFEEIEEGALPVVGGRRTKQSQTQTEAQQAWLVTATSVYEEGKDLPEVSFLIITEPTSDPTRNSQREGRLRRDDGLIVYVLTPGDVRSFRKGFEAQLQSKVSFARILPGANHSKR